MRAAKAKRPAARIEAIVARNAAVAVIFRRGPSRRVRMLKWNLSNDRIEGGQWIDAGVRVTRCDVSPNGELMRAEIHDRETATACDLDPVDRVDADHKGDVLWSARGQLFRLAGPTRRGMNVDAEPKMVADLNDMTFAAIEAPRRAMKWP
jgi:hypothetical protein